MEAVRLKPSVEPFAASTGDLYLLRGDGAGDVVLRDAPPFAHELIRALAAGAAPGNGAALTNGAAAIEELRAAGVLAEDRSERPAGFSPGEAERYDRQLHYFADRATSERGRWDMQAALRDATVAVLGAGGLGTWTLAGLACAGVGTLVVVDDDTVELSNLNRQVLYRTADLGRPKAGVAAEALEALNPHTNVVPVERRLASVDDVRAAIGGADFVVCTADQPAHRIGRWVNEACLEAGVPHTSAGQFPPRIRVGPTFVPGRTACLACQELAIRRDFPLFDELAEQRAESAPVAATLGAPSGLIGSLLSMDVIHHLTGIGEPATLGRGLVFDLRDFSTDWEPVAPEPDCPLRCGEVRSDGCPSASTSPSRTTPTR